MPLERWPESLKIRFLWPCTIGLVRGVGRCFIYILRGCRGAGYLIRSNKEWSPLITVG